MNPTKRRWRLPRTDLKQTAITQPAVLATETALARLLGAYGIVSGHGDGAQPGRIWRAGGCRRHFLRRGTAGRERARQRNDPVRARRQRHDGGRLRPDRRDRRKFSQPIDDYVVIANINSTQGSRDRRHHDRGRKGDGGSARRRISSRSALQVSHAFHTKIVAPAGDSLAKILGSMNLRPPAIPIITNVTGEFYPMGPGVVPEMIESAGEAGVLSGAVHQRARTLSTTPAPGSLSKWVPKRILYGFVEDVLGEREGVVPLFTNHPRIGEAASLNLALCGLYAAGLGVGEAEEGSR